MARDVGGPTIRAAGGVVWRPVDGPGGDEGVEVALIHRPRYDDWSIPKGKLAPGESEVEGAIREVLEETGHRVRVGRPLGEARYLKTSNGVTRPKVVRYWAMRADGGSFSPSREVDELRWMSPAEAAELVTRDHDRDLLERFVRGPTITASVLVVRHASAGDSSKWKGDDRLRPLDDRGQLEADELVRLLSRFDVQDILSADYARCLQTVAPLSESIRVPIREKQCFAEDGYPGRQEKAERLLRKYGTAGTVAVVCSQGEVIKDLIPRLAARDAVDLHPNFEAAKGSVWALNFDGRNLYSAEYFPPPKVEPGGS